MKDYKVVVLVSGGMDSAVVLAQAIETYGRTEVVAVNLVYGQRHIVEVECARKICNHFNVELLEMDVSAAFSNINSALLVHSDVDINDGQDKNHVGSTFVPGRNIIFLAIAAGIADSMGAIRILYGAHRDDHSGYPDCSPAFINFMRKAVIAGTDNGVEISAPFGNKFKSEIVKEGVRLRVPFGITHSCYRGERPACGTCPTCELRLQAFKDAGYEDLIKYKDNTKTKNWG